jgi:hypothetical protein
MVAKSKIENGTYLLGQKRSAPRGLWDSWRLAGSQQPSGARSRKGSRLLGREQEELQRKQNVRFSSVGDFPTRPLPPLLLRVPLGLQFVSIHRDPEPLYKPSHGALSAPGLGGLAQSGRPQRGLLWATTCATVCEFIVDHHGRHRADAKFLGSLCHGGLIHIQNTDLA